MDGPPAPTTPATSGTTSKPASSHFRASLILITPAPRCRSSRKSARKYFCNSLLLREEPRRAICLQAQDAGISYVEQTATPARGSTVSNACSRAEQHRWLCSVLRGHDAYYGLPSNHHALTSFHNEVRRICFARSLGEASGDSLGPTSMRWPSTSHFPSQRSPTSARLAHDSGYLREETSAGKPHARIREGEAEWPSYSTYAGDDRSRRSRGTRIDRRTISLI